MVAGTKWMVVVAAVVMVASSTSFGALLPSDVVAYYAFEDAGYSTASDTVNNNDGSVVVQSAGGGFVSGGIGGNAWQTTANGAFPAGVSDYINVGTSDVQLIGDDTFTLTGWFKFTDLTSSGTQNNHFFDTDRGGANPGYRISMQAGHGGQPQNLVFQSNGGNALIDISANRPWQEDKWYFVAARLDGAGSSVIWTVEEDNTWANRMGAAGTGNAPAVGSESLDLGRRGGAGAFEGLRDDLAIWNRNLTTAEIEGIFNAGVQGQDLRALGIPEPASLVLMGIGGFAMLRRRS